jgi:hypothetical protein
MAGHPKAKRRYAWSYPDKGEAQYVAALEIPPVESPITVVMAAIVAEVKKRRKNERKKQKYFCWCLSGFEPYSLEYVLWRGYQWGVVLPPVDNQCVTKTLCQSA